MRGTRLFVLVFVTWGMACAAVGACAQQAPPESGQQAPQQTSQQDTEKTAPTTNTPEKPTINPWKTPPPPVEEPPTPAKPPARELPAKVTLAGGTRIDVVLETPLSTRIAKMGQEVVFRATQPIALGDGMELSEQTAFIGVVVEAKRPGIFGRQGALRVELKRLDLPSGSSAAIAGRIDSPDMKGKGRISSDSNRKSDLANLALWTVAGTVIGADLGGGKGAGYGAASGAAVALIRMMSHRGADVYLEPGMPFAVLLDEPVELPGASARFSVDNPSGQPGAAVNPGSDMPKLTRRPKPQS